MSGKAVLVDWFDDIAQGRLHDPIPHRRYAQRPFLGRARLWYPNSPYRRGLIARLSQLLFKDEQSLCAVFGEAFYRDAVHAAATCVGRHLCPSRLKVLV